MLIHLFNIISIINAINEDRAISERNGAYLAAGIVELLLFDSLVIIFFKTLFGGWCD